MSENQDEIILKWGTLKGWHLNNSPESFEAIQKYHDLGVSVSAMVQEDSKEQKKLICEAIDKLNGKVWNDWNSYYFATKEDAKDYILNYRR